MREHTPGPWTLRSADVWGPTEPKGHDGRLGRIRGFTEEDARLIAAAPESLDELIRTREWLTALAIMQSPNGLEARIQAITRVIAKATGTET